jgi:hypothetical protein
MKKEIILAIIIGLTLGLVLTYGFYTARRSLSGRGRPQLSATPQPTPGVDSELLTILSPQDESVQSKKEVTVTGNTFAKGFVVVFINAKEFITTADDTGNFSVIGELAPGGNTIHVTALDENGQSVSVERTVVFLTSDLLTSTGQATPSAKVAPSPSPSPKASLKATAVPKVTPKPSPTP